MVMLISPCLHATLPTPCRHATLPPHRSNTPPPQGEGDLDAELAAMKANTLTGSSSETKALTGQTSGEVEDELEKLKREMGN